MFKFTTKDPFEETDKEYTISLYEEPFCEHCYDLEPFEATIDLDIQYCVSCCSANGIEIPENLLIKIKAKQKELKIEFYKKKLKELE